MGLVGASVSESEEFGLEETGKGINIAKEVSQWSENINVAGNG